MSTPSAEQQLRFISGIQRILDEGSFVATYKYALLMALADFAIQSGQDGADPVQICVDDLSENFILLYWRQALPYAPSAKVGVQLLRMSTGGPPVILKTIANLRSQYNGSWSALRSSGRDWNALKAKVAKTIADMPLWKLQVVGSEPNIFLYKQNGQGFQGRDIELLPGVLFNFRNHYDLIRNLVQGAWLRHVRRLNLACLGEADLDEFLFGSERTVCSGLRDILRDVQEGRCFYCNRIIRDNGDIDHFIPWSRYPIEYGHNFVLAHASCNRSKSDLLAAPEYLERWCMRNALHASSLVDSFDEQRILHDFGTTKRITRWAYNQAELCGAHLWRSNGNFVLADSAWRSILTDD